jgi:hypothetical protein
MSYFLAQIVTESFEFRFCFFILAKRLKEALAGFKTETEEKLVVKSWISLKNTKIKERQN